jgi:cellulose synthase (UDP-forming)
MVIRRKTLEEVGGLCETNIAEDFLTSLFIHERGWKSIYVPEVLAVGLAPEDLLSYTNQQFRWARGGLEVVFRYNPFLRSGLTWSQRVEYLASASHWLSGLVIALSALFPLLYFFFNLTPVRSSNMMLAAIFLPYMYCVVALLRNSSGATYSFRAIAFSYSCFALQIRAVCSVLLGIKAGFVVTSKQRLEGNFVGLAVPHLVYLLLAVVGFLWTYRREGMSPALAANTTWALFNLAMFAPYIWAALPWHAQQSATVATPAPAPNVP